ncbi:hypothetical protein Pelo_12377 [Pelomyxa schiedti]|nr:hypothetical protein Pelo_12377 [Pelomyxa schiedti]
MNSDTIISKLNEVIHLDIDAWHAYDLVVQKVPKGEISSNLASFQADHMRHVEDMSTLVTKLTSPHALVWRNPTEICQGFQGLHDQRDGDGQHCVCAHDDVCHVDQREADQQDVRERGAVGHGHGAGGRDWDRRAGRRQLVEGGWEDEKRHLRWINEAIEREAWNKEPAWPTE